MCFETVKGSRCLQLICSHTFCRACLRDGWSLYIAEGDIARVGCLDPQCIKDGREATEDEVRRVVTEEEVRRWKRLREKKAAERGEFSVVCASTLSTHCVQILRLHCVQWFSVKRLCRNRRGRMFKTTTAGKGCERAPRATTPSVHFARGHGKGVPLNAVGGIDRGTGTDRYLIALFRLQKSS